MDGIFHVSSVGGKWRLHAHAAVGLGIFSPHLAQIVETGIYSNTAQHLSGGGIYSFPNSATLTNAIVANSPFGGNCSGPISGSFNLSCDNTCGFGNGRGNVNMMLAPLGNYGGPLKTHILYGNSPAIDFGTNTGLSVHGSARQAASSEEHLRCRHSGTASDRLPVLISAARSQVIRARSDAINRESFDFFSAR